MVMGYNRWIVYNEVPVQGEKLDQIYVTRCKRTWSITVAGRFLYDRLWHSHNVAAAAAVAGRFVTEKSVW